MRLADPIKPQQKHPNQILQRQIFARKLVLIFENTFFNGRVGVLNELIVLVNFGNADGVEFVNYRHIKRQHLLHGVGGKRNEITLGARLKLQTVQYRLRDGENGRF